MTSISLRPTDEATKNSTLNDTTDMHDDNVAQDAHGQPGDAQTNQTKAGLANASLWLALGSVATGLAGLIISSSAFRDLFTGPQDPGGGWISTAAPDDYIRSPAFGLAALLGLAAIVTGHLARLLARKSSQIPRGRATAGLAIGYLSTIFWAVHVFALAPHSIAKDESVACAHQLQELWVGAKYWAEDHNGVLPPNFSSMSNEIAQPKILHCPSDKARQAAKTVNELSDLNTTYVMVSPHAPLGDQTVFVRCPIHGLTLRADGNISK